MTSQPATLEGFKAEVQDFAFRALAEFKLRYFAGQRDFSIEEHFDRSKVKATPDGRGVESSWYQLLFYDIVQREIEGMPGVVAYADFMHRPDADHNFSNIEDMDIIAYRLSANEER